MKLGNSLARMITFMVVGFGLTQASPLRAFDRTGHLGLGFTNQMRNGIPALSVKIQPRSTHAYGATVAFKSGDDGGLGVGLKYFKNLYDEPLQTFYVGAHGALLQTKVAGKSTSGYQVDAFGGTEFSFEKLESLAFSFEAGLSIYKTGNDMVVQTMGDHFITSGIHFYF